MTLSSATCSTSESRGPNPAASSANPSRFGLTSPEAESRFSRHQRASELAMSRSEGLVLWPDTSLDANGMGLPSNSLTPVVPPRQLTREVARYRDAAHRLLRMPPKRPIAPLSCRGSPKRRRAPNISGTLRRFGDPRRSHCVPAPGICVHGPFREGCRTDRSSDRGERSRLHPIHECPDKAWARRIKGTAGYERRLGLVTDSAYRHARRIG